MMDVDPAQMHQEHREALSEHEIWLDEIQRWQGQQRQMLAALDEVINRVRLRDYALDDHTAEILRHERLMHQHERRMADIVLGFGREDEAPLTDRHETLLSEHERVRQVHERFKHEHRDAMVELRRLMRALEPHD